RLPDIGPAFEESGRQTGRNLRRRVELLEGLATRHLARILAEEQVNGILRLADRALDARNLSGSGVEQLLGLVNIEAGSDAAFAAQRGEAKAIFGNLASLTRDEQLRILLPKLEIARCHIGDQRGGDAVAGFVTREILRARGLCETAQPAPEIQFPS